MTEGHDDPAALAEGRRKFRSPPDATSRCALRFAPSGAPRAQVPGRAIEFESFYMTSRHGCGTMLRVTPPSSSGLGRGPLKAKTGVRNPLGALPSAGPAPPPAGFFISGG